MRLDALLIWGHGLAELDSILAMVRRTPGFKIRRVIQRDIDDMQRFVRSVYNFDYAPYRHLIDKTRYLMQTPPKFAVIFADNLEPDEHETGSGRFAHIECRKMTALKRRIREHYNPRVDGKMTEHHIVHGTDHAGQTQAIIELLGYKKFSELINRTNRVLPAPEHLPTKQEWNLQSIPMNSIYARISTTSSVSDADVSHVLLPLSQTPHAMMLAGEPETYKQYWAQYRGSLLQDDHAPDAFQYLADQLDYLGEDHPNSYLLFEQLDHDRFVLLDGVHRAAILRQRGEQSLIGAVAA